MLADLIVESKSLLVIISSRVKSPLASLIVTEFAEIKSTSFFVSCRILAGMIRLTTELLTRVLVRIPKGGVSGRLMDR